MPGRRRASVAACDTGAMTSSDEGRTRPVADLRWPPPLPAPGSPLAQEFADVLGVDVSATAPVARPHIPAPPVSTASPATISSDATLAPRAPGPARPAEIVPAVHCPQHHPNPPGTSSCRICGAPLTDPAVTGVARPDLGALVLPDGTRVPVDGRLLLGRNPAMDGRQARLVRLPDPDGVLSRTHLEVRTSRWQVQVVDCGSTNGTAITSTEGTRALVPNAPAELRSGDLLVLGGTVTVVFDTNIQHP